MQFTHEQQQNIRMQNTKMAFRSILIFFSYFSHFYRSCVLCCHRVECKLKAHRWPQRCAQCSIFRTHTNCNKRNWKRSVGRALVVCKSSALGHRIPRENKCHVMMLFRLHTNQHRGQWTSKNAIHDTRAIALHEHEHDSIRCKSTLVLCYQRFMSDVNLIRNALIRSALFINFLLAHESVCFVCEEEHIRQMASNTIRISQ